MDKDDTLNEDPRDTSSDEIFTEEMKGGLKRATPLFTPRNVLLYNWRGIIGLLVFRNAEQQAEGYAML
jgi:hypothetical protein